MINEYSKFLGKIGTVVLHNLTINVKIEDIKESYGKIRFLVSPVSGSGMTWIESVALSE